MKIHDTYDTICAPATIPGTGAVSMIRVSGSSALNVADAVVSFRHGKAADTPGGRVKFGTVCRDGGEVLDEVLVSIFRAPHSYTGEDSVEISCHASSYIVSELLHLLTEAGCRFAEPGEFTQRSFINGKMDLAQAEAVADVISSTTEASHRVAFKQLKGGFSDELGVLRGQLLQMASLLELELDFSEEDVEFADRGRLVELLETVLGRVERLASSFKLGNAIKNGVPVAIVGATNAGKSTLLNAILGEQRAIVSEIAGTTRDSIEETFNVDGVLFRFIDTAGIRSGSSDVIENIGIERSFASMKKAEIVLVVIDASDPDYDSLEAIAEHVDFCKQKVVFVLNKSDKENASEWQKADAKLDESDAKWDKFDANKNVTDVNTIVSLINFKDVEREVVLRRAKQVKISAKTGEGLSELLKTLSELEKSELSAASEESVLVTNFRHYQALTSAAKDLRAVRSGIDSSLPTDLLAEDLRSALSTLGSITGEITHTEVLENIFKNFCIGK